MFVSKGKKNLNINKLYNSYHSSFLQKWICSERKRKKEEEEGEEEMKDDKCDNKDDHADRDEEERMVQGLQRDKRARKLSCTVGRQRRTTGSLDGQLTIHSELKCP